MKTLYLLLLLFVIQIGNSQNNILDVFTKANENYSKNNQLWTDDEVYEMAKEYNIQDSLFSSSGILKNNFSISRYMPKSDINKYFYDLRRFYESMNYRSEIQSVSTIDEWLNLLAKYPTVANSLKNDKVFTMGLSFEEFVNKVKNSEIFLFLDGKGIVVIPNIHKNFEEKKHMKRLK